MILDSIESLFRGLHNPTEYLIQNTMDKSSISLQEPTQSPKNTEKPFLLPQVDKKEEGILKGEKPF